MKYCLKCGNEVTDDETVCPRCGSCAISPTNIYKSSSNEKNGFAIAGFICSFFSPLLGWIFGGIGLNKAYKKGGCGEKLSIAAIIISTIIFGLNLILLILFRQKFKI